MPNFGIDKLNFYTPNYYLPLEVLAEARHIDPNKFVIGLGQKAMSIAPPDEDIVTMAANAALPLLLGEDLAKISAVFFATESGIDFSKAAALYVHKLLGLPKHCLVVEMKQACFGATAGLQLALAMLKQNPDQKILLLASDVARYSLESAAESSQGAGAVAMLLSAKPRTLIIEAGSGYYAEELMDFWRPNYKREALVDGKYSCEIYLKFLEATWRHYYATTNRAFTAHDYFCYHVPVPKLVLRAHKRLNKINGINLTDEQIKAAMQNVLHYNAEVGNCYTASLYLSMLSLLEIGSDDLSGKRLALYSYGSGASAEFFSAQVVEGYREFLDPKAHQNLLASRQKLTYAKYLEFYNFVFPEDGSDFVIDKVYSKGKFRLSGIAYHQRQYV